MAEDVPYEHHPKSNRHLHNGSEIGGTFDSIETLLLEAGDADAGNYTEFEADGTMQAHGDSTCWDDIESSLIGRRLASNSGSVDYNYAENSVSFGNGGDISNINDCVSWNNQKPHKMVTGGEFRLHMHWWQTDAVDREITIWYRVQSNSAAKTTAWTEVVTGTNANNVFTYTSGTLNQITNLATIDLTGASISSTVQFRMTRSDSESGNVDITFVDSHYEIDTLGSREEFTK